MSRGRPELQLAAAAAHLAVGDARAALESWPGRARGAAAAECERVCLALRVLRVAAQMAISAGWRALL